MNKSSAFFFLFIIINLVTLLSCSNNHNKKGVEAAMKLYDHFIQKMDADSIAWLYTPDGNLGDIARGRDSIRKFLASFKNVRVISQSSATSFLELIGDSSIQKGTYQQTVIVSEKDTVKVKGEFTANWLWIPSDGWHIRRMTTKSLN